MKIETTPEQEKGIQEAEEERLERCRKVYLKDFVKLVESMRQAQVRYFTGGRKPSDLQESKELERKVDTFLKEQHSNQTSLF
jgi:hypothetical protein